jgi:hypothetical protein
MWKKLIKRGDRVGLELTKSERKLLLTGLVFLHEGVEEALRSTPPGKPLMITLGDLEDMAGHVAGEANHAKSKQVEATLDGIYEKVEELLDRYTEESGPQNGGSTNPAESFTGRLVDVNPTIFPIPPKPKRDGTQYPVKLTTRQRDALLHATRLRRGIKNKIEQVPEGTQIVRFAKKELEETAREVDLAVRFAPIPYGKRLEAVYGKLKHLLNADCRSDLPPEHYEGVD